MTRTVDDLHPVLLDQTIRGSLVVYEVKPRPDGQIGDLTILHPTMLGIEYPKTFGHYHVPPHSETYEIQEGQGVVLVQQVDTMGKLIDFKSYPVAKGDAVTVPEGYGHVLVNTGLVDLVTLDNWDPAWAKHDYQSIIDKQGFAYYLVRGATEPELIPNPKYSISVRP